jgi:RNA polymerase sigma factor (sigma-70 family)
MPSPSVALLRTQSDERLVTLAAAGHERAFEAIVERYRRRLIRSAQRYLPDARAEDAVQQALVSAWAALRRGDEVRDLSAWLHRIVRNTSLNALRVQGYDYEELRETLEGGGGPAEAAERRAVVRGTLAGLAALPERQRDALLQIAVEGRSQDEVAAELGLTQNAVRQLVHRARTKLRAAATAVVPLPVAAWLATAGGGRADVALRVTEIVSGAGAGATLAKAGAVAVIAGGAVAGPAVVRQPDERVPQGAAATTAQRTEVRARTPTPAPPPAAAPIAPVSTSGEGERRAVEAGAGREEDAQRRTRDRRRWRGGGDEGARRPGTNGGIEEEHGRGGRPWERDDDDGGGERHEEDSERAPRERQRNWGDDAEAWDGDRREGAEGEDDDVAGHHGSDDDSGDGSLGRGGAYDDGSGSYDRGSADHDGGGGSYDRSGAYDDGGGSDDLGSGDGDGDSDDVASDDDSASDDDVDARSGAD